MKSPRILLWDIETSYIIAEVHTLYPDSISYDNVIQDWYIICASWKWEGEKQIHAVSVLDNKARFNRNHTDDFHVIKTMYETISNADAIVAHNGDAFDLKKFNARAILHGFDPLPDIIQYDTLKIARSKFRFTSNRLDALGSYLGVGRKIVNQKGLWSKCTHGCAESIKKMVRYNKGDIRLLSDVWDILKPWTRAKLNMKHFEGEGCPSCGSNNRVKNGVRYNYTRTYQRYQCKDCGHAYPGELIK